MTRWSSSIGRVRCRALSVGLAALLLGGSCATQPTAVDFRPLTTIKDLMEYFVDPSADMIWDAVGTKMTVTGKEERAPRTDEEWIVVRRGAVQLIEAANVLQIPGRPVTKPGERNGQGELTPEQIASLINQDRASWIAMTHGLQDATKLALTAIDAKDPVKLMETGGLINDACDRCHQVFVFPPQLNLPPVK